MCLMRAALAECAVPELRAALEDVVQNAWILLLKPTLAGRRAAHHWRAWYFGGPCVIVIHPAHCWERLPYDHLNPQPMEALGGSTVGVTYHALWWPGPQPTVAPRFVSRYLKDPEDLFNGAAFYLLRHVVEVVDFQ
jgi:hypothetical protein